MYNDMSFKAPSNPYPWGTNFDYAKETASGMASSARKKKAQKLWSEADGVGQAIDEYIKKGITGVDTYGPLLKQQVDLISEGNAYWPHVESS